MRMVEYKVIFQKRKLSLIRRNLPIINYSKITSILNNSLYRFRKTKAQLYWPASTKSRYKNTQILSRWKLGPFLPLCKKRNRHCYRNSKTVIDKLVAICQGFKRMRILEMWPIYRTSAISTPKIKLIIAINYSKYWKQVIQIQIIRSRQ